MPGNDRLGIVIPGLDPGVQGQGTPIGAGPDR